MLIGLHGKAGSGKDTAYSFIKEWADERGRPCRRDAFADRLKHSAARALGYEGDRDQCVALCNSLKLPGWEVIVREPDGKSEHAISGREYLQYYGTEAHRQVFADNFWVAAVMTDLNPFHAEADAIVVITDVRFENEAEAIHWEGGQVWQILRTGDTINEDAHASERPLPTDVIDHIIYNDQDLTHLRRLVQSQIDLVSV